MPLSNAEQRQIPPFRTSAGCLITARSYLIDRFVPDCEIISLPEKITEGGQLSFGLRSDGMAKSHIEKKWYQQWYASPSHPQTSDGRVIFDFRLHYPQNWAHFLNNHLSIFRASLR